MESGDTHLVVCWFGLPNLNMEMYRSGRNENDSKSFCPEMGTWVRIPPSPPEILPAAGFPVAGFFVFIEIFSSSA